MLAIERKLMHGLPERVDNLCSYGRRPSSSGSHVSVMFIDPVDVF